MMWKKLKKCGNITLFILIGIGFVLSLAPVQKAIFKHKLSKYCDTVTLQHFKIGFKSINFENLSIKKNKSSLDLKSAKINWSLVDYLFFNKLCINDATIDEISISSLSDKKSNSAKEETEGQTLADISTHRILKKFKKFFSEQKKLHMPFSATINECNINGKINISNILNGTFSLTAKNICQFMKGKICTKFNLEDSNLNTTVCSCNVNILQNGESEIEQFDITSQCLYKDKASAVEQNLLFSSNWQDTSDKTKFNMNLLDKTSNQELINVDCEFLNQTQIFSLITKTDIDQDSFKFLAILNDNQIFSIESVASFEYNFKKSLGILNGNALINISQEYISKYLPNIDSNALITISNNTNFEQQMINIHDCKIAVKTDSKSCDIGIALPKILSFHQKHFGSLRMISGYSPGIAINIRNLDSLLFKNFLGEKKLEGKLNGQYNLQYNREVLMLSSQPDQSTRVANLLIQIGEEPMAKLKNTSCDIQFCYGSDIKLSISNFFTHNDENRNIMQGDIDIVKNKQQTVIKLYCISDIPSLLSQNLFNVENAPKSGILSTKLEITQNNKDIVAKLDAKLKGLLFEHQTSSTDVSCVAEFNKKGKEISAHMPIIIDSIDTSDITMDVNGSIQKKKQINISTESSSVYPKDLASIVSLFHVNQQALCQNLVKPETTGQQNIQQTDKNSVWSDYTVSLKTKIDKIFFSKDYMFSNLAMNAFIDEEQINLENISINMSEAPFKAKCKIGFDSSATSEYYVEGSYSLKNFDAGRFFRAIQKKNKPTFSGIVSMFGTLSGNSETFDTLSKNVIGKLKVEGYNGSFKILSSADNKTKSAIMLTNVASMIVNRNIPSSNLTTNLIDAINSVDYDSLSCEIIKDQSKDINLKFLTVRGPEILLLSNGTIFSDDSQKISDQKLNLSSQINVKGKLAKSFSDLGLIEGEMPNSDYLIGPSFTIRGTITKPDFADLKAIIQQAGIHLITNKKF